MLTTIRLCVDSGQPIDPGNYDGPTHCIGHPEGHDCVTALFRIDRSTLTFESERAPQPVEQLGPTFVCTG